MAMVDVRTGAMRKRTRGSKNALDAISFSQREIEDVSDKISTQGSE